MSRPGSFSLAGWRVVKTAVGDEGTQCDEQELQHDDDEIGDSKVRDGLTDFLP